MKQHNYVVQIEWTGNKGEGTKNYQAYERAHTISAAGKPSLAASSDIVFRGDASKYNPEDLLIAAVSSCHMLWYLHLCADAGIVVTAYKDEAKGTLSIQENGSGKITQVTLYPSITITDATQLAQAAALHHEAHKFCFIANSVNFPVHLEPTTIAL